MRPNWNSIVLEYPKCHWSVSCIKIKYCKSHSCKLITLNPSFQFNTKQISNCFFILKYQRARFACLPGGHWIFHFQELKILQNQVPHENADKPINVEGKNGTLEALYRFSDCVTLYKRLHFCIPFPSFKNAEGTRDSRLHPAKHSCPNLLSYTGGLPGNRAREAYISEAQQLSFTAWAYAHHCQIS